KDPEDLKAWESLAGERDEVVKTRNSEGKVTSTPVRKTPVLASAQLAALPEFRVVVFSDMPPPVGRVPPVGKARGRPQAPLPAPARAHAHSHPGARSRGCRAHPGARRCLPLTRTPSRRETPLPPRRSSPGGWTSSGS